MKRPKNSTSKLSKMKTALKLGIYHKDDLSTDLEKRELLLSHKQTEKLTESIRPSFEISFFLIKPASRLSFG